MFIQNCSQNVMWFINGCDMISVCHFSIFFTSYLMHIHLLFFFPYFLPSYYFFILHPPVSLRLSFFFFKHFLEFLLISFLNISFTKSTFYFCFCFLTSFLMHILHMFVFTYFLFTFLILSFMLPTLASSSYFSHWFYFFLNSCLYSLHFLLL